MQTYYNEVKSSFFQCNVFGNLQGKGGDDLEIFSWNNATKDMVHFICGTSKNKILKGNIRWKKYAILDYS